MKYVTAESIEIIRKSTFEAGINAETCASGYSITCLSYRYAAYGMRRAREDDGSLPGVENPELGTIENSDRIVIAMSRGETAIPLELENSASGI